MPIGIMKIEFYLPACSSLKDKRHILKPMLARLHKEFNISIAEYDHLDVWKSSTIMIAMVSNDSKYLQRHLLKIQEFIKGHWPDLQITKDNIEIIV